MLRHVSPYKRILINFANWCKSKKKHCFFLETKNVLKKGEIFKEFLFFLRKSNNSDRTIRWFSNRTRGNQRSLEGGVPEIVNIAIENWFSSRDICFRQSRNLRNIWSKLQEKSIFHRNFIKISKIYWKIQNFSWFFVQSYKTLHACIRKNESEFPCL